MTEFYSRHAIRLDAEYDAGASDHHSNDESDDLECFVPIGKLSRKAGSSFTSSKRGDKKRQKTQEKEVRKPAAVVEKADLMADSDGSDSDLEPMASHARPMASSNSPSQRKINALQKQMKQVVDGYNSTAAAFADVSAAEEPEEAGALCGCGGLGEELRKSIKIQEQTSSKCVIEVKASDNEQGKKFRIFMTDPMSKIFTAYCAKAKYHREAVKFVFDGLAVVDTATPQDLGMEEEDENMIELQVRRR